MSVLASLGRLGEVTPVRRLDLPSPREKFVSWQIAPHLVLRDVHHGNPLAYLDTYDVEDDGNVIAFLDPLDQAAEAQIRAKAAKSKALSIEFAAQREEVRPDVTLHGGSCLMHHGATIVGVAFATSPARDDARILHISDTREPATTQVRARGGARVRPLPKQLQDRIDGKRVWGAPYHGADVQLTYR